MSKSKTTAINLPVNAYIQLFYITNCNLAIALILFCLNEQINGKTDQHINNKICVICYSSTYGHSNTSKKENNTWATVALQRYSTRMASSASLPARRPPSSFSYQTLSRATTSSFLSYGPPRPRSRQSRLPSPKAPSPPWSMVPSPVLLAELPCSS